MPAQLSTARALASRSSARLLSALLLLFALLASPATARQVIDLRSGDVDTAGAPGAARGPDASLRLVQFDGPVRGEQLRAMKRAGIEVLGYLPPHAFLVRAGEQIELQELGARWSGPYLAQYKMSPQIAASGESAVDGAARQRLRPVLLHVVPDRPVQDVVRRIETLIERPVAGFAQREHFSRIRVLLKDAEIALFRDRLAEIGEVVWIEKEARRELKNETTIWVGQSSLDGGMTTPVFDAGLLGAGQVVGVLDTGVDIDSCYFRDPGEMPAMNLCDSASTAVNLDHRKVIAVDFLWSQDCDGGVIASDEWDSNGHGTHVGGTVAGDSGSSGVHDNADGMAPQAKLVVQDCGYSPDDCADCPGIGACPVVDLNPVFQQAYDQGARIHTNSWGDEENDPNTGEYTAGSQDADEFMWNHKDFLLFFAAGNNGGTSGSVDSPSTAKNVVSVGSTERASNAGSISGFSSWGPTQDGRIKPDITNPGSNIRSAGNDADITTNNCSNAFLSGTSMATPGAAGLASLVRQYFTDGFYPTGAPSPGDAFTPSAALTKAVLINSGTPMSGEGEIPSDSQGWGRIFLDSALHFTGDDRRLWVHDEATGFATGLEGATSHTYLLDVAAGEPLEVTLAWTDFPALVGAGTALVNDLDLEVSGPDGIFRGNVFAGGVSVAGGSADRLNSVENVLVADPTPGIWTLTVSAWNVPSGPQPYALVAAGGEVAECGGAPDLTAAGASSLAITSGDGDAYLDNCEAAEIGFTVSNRGLAAATNARLVSVSSPSHPESAFLPASWSEPSLGACSNTEASVSLLGASGLASAETLEIELELTWDEIAPATRTAMLQLANTERDLVAVAERLWSFESGGEGWSVDSGTFNRTDAIGGADGSSWYRRSSANQNGQCDVILSPQVRLTAGSTLSMWTSYDIEDFSGQWWDRANVSVIGTAVQPVQPDGGRPYDVPQGADNGVCGTTGEAGWAGTQESWAESRWSAAALGSAALAGEPVRLDVRYGTDPAAVGDGFRFDQVRLTDILEEGVDTQPDACDLGIFADGFETGDTSRWSASVP